MASFTLPALAETPDAWGPPAEPSGSHSVLPPDFEGIPFVPFAKSDKIGRIADWNATSDNASVAGDRGRGGRSGRGGRDGGAQSYGAGAAASTFAYFHGDDEATFSVVDNAKAAPRGRGGLASFSRGRGRGGARGGARGAAPTRGGARGTGRGGVAARGGAARRGGWKDWDKPQRVRDPSVDVGAEWEQLEEIDFSRLSKLRLEVGEPTEISAHGTLYEYDRAYDRISSVRFEKPLQPLDRVRYNPTTHDDPILLDEAAKPAQAGADGTAAPVRIFATDSILALLMTANRSLYPWDVVVTVDPVGNIFLDKRDGGAFDFVSVNENAADPPLDANEAAALADGKDAKSATAVNSINTPGNLSLEATFINQNFAFQVVNEKKSKQLPGGPNPFYDAAAETDTLASCGYRYRKWDVSSSADEPVEIYVRTEVDALLPPASKGAAPQYITIKTLNEFDSRAQGAGGAPDWRSKLDAQRGAVVATEMKNNSAKLARFAVQSILAGADNMKMGYISRANARDASRHVILGTQWYKPREFAAQINVNLANGWGIVRTIADLARKATAEPGMTSKFVLMKDPNKQVLRFYRVPATWGTEDDEELGEE